MHELVQVLNPEDFFEREAVRSVNSPPTVGTLLDEGVFSELGLRVWLGVAASAGWGGDRYLTDNFNP